MCFAFKDYYKYEKKTREQKKCKGEKITVNKMETKMETCKGLEKQTIERKQSKIKARGNRERRVEKHIEEGQMQN